MRPFQRAGARRHEPPTDLRRRLRTSINGYEIATMTPAGGIAHKRAFTGTYVAMREAAFAHASRHHITGAPAPIPVFRRIEDALGVWRFAQMDSPVTA